MVLMSAAKYIDVQGVSSAVFSPLFFSSKGIIYEAKTKTRWKRGNMRYSEREREITKGDTCAEQHRACGAI